MDDYSTRAVIVWPFILAARFLALLVVLGIAAGCGERTASEGPRMSDAEIQARWDHGDRYNPDSGLWDSQLTPPPPSVVLPLNVETVSNEEYRADLEKILRDVKEGRAHTTPAAIATLKQMLASVPQRSPVVAKETALRGGNGENRPAGVRDAGGGPVGGNVTDGSGFDSRRTPAAAPPLNRPPVVAENPKGTEASKPIAAQRLHKVTLQPWTYQKSERSDMVKRAVLYFDPPLELGETIEIDETFMHDDVTGEVPIRLRGEIVYGSNKP
jgi:hypothetical protein